MIDFIEEELFRVDPNDDTLPINEFIASFTEESSGFTGTLYYPEPFLYLNQSVDVILDGDLELKVHETKMEGLNSMISPVDLAIPVGPYVVNNILTFAAVNASTKVLFGVYRGMLYCVSSSHIAFQAFS